MLVYACKAYMINDIGNVILFQVIEHKIERKLDIE